MLLGSGTSAVTALAVLADGSIIVGDGVTDPVAITAFTSSTGLLIHERGGLEVNISAIADGGMVVGTGAGTMAIRASVLTAGVAGFLKHELGGLEFNASAITTDQFLGGTALGVIGIRTAAQVTTSLALTIGTDTQAWDANLDQIAALAPTNNNFIVGTGAVWALETPANVRTSLGLVIGTDVQAEDAGLTSIAGLTTLADRMIYTTASDVYAVTTLTLTGRNLIDDASISAQRTTLGLVIGTDVQAFDTHLEDLSALTPAVGADEVMVSTAAGVWARESGTTLRTSLGLAIGTDVQDDVVTTRGDLIRGSATGTAERLAIGTILQFLGNDGTDVAWETLPTANFTQAGIIEVASQAEMEAGTADDRTVVASRVQSHSSAAKAWVKTDLAGTLNASYRVTSITDTGTGDFTVNWSDTFTSVNYAVTATLLASGFTGSIDIDVEAQGTTTLDIQIADGAARTETSVAGWYVAAYGEII